MASPERSIHRCPERDRHGPYRGNSPRRATASRIRSITLDAARGFLSERNSWIRSMSKRAVSAYRIFIGRTFSKVRPFLHLRPAQPSHLAILAAGALLPGLARPLGKPGHRNQPCERTKLRRVHPASLPAVYGPARSLPRTTWSCSSLRRRALVSEAAVELLHELDCRVGDHRAGREDRLRAGGFERIVVLRWDDAADHDHDVAAALPVELGLELG